MHLAEYQYRRPINAFVYDLGMIRNLNALVSIMGLSYEYVKCETSALMRWANSYCQCIAFPV